MTEEKTPKKKKSSKIQTDDNLASSIDDKQDIIDNTCNKLDVDILLKELILQPSEPEQTRTEKNAVQAEEKKDVKPKNGFGANTISVGGFNNRRKNRNNAANSSPAVRVLDHIYRPFTNKK